MIRMEGQLQNELKIMREELVRHIFFPRELSTESNSDGIAKVESTLLSLLSSVVQNLNMEVLNAPLAKTRQLFTKWKSIQLQNGFDVPLLSSEIKSLQAGDSIALYVRAQNSGLILSIPPNGDHGHDSEQVILSAFAASQPSGTVMGANGVIRACFPGYSYHVPKSALLESKALADLLSTLNRDVQDFATPHSRKMGSNVQETRDVSDPIFITQWLPAALSTEKSDLCAHYKSVVKKIRDQVTIGRSKLPFRRSGLWMAGKVVLHLSLVNEIKDEVQARIIYKIAMLKLLTTCAKIWCEDLNADIGMQVIAKIARRMLKLHDYVRKNNVTDKLQQYFQTSANEAEALVIKIQENLELKWKSYISDLSSKSELNYIAPSDFREDTFQKLKKLTAYIKMRNETIYPAQTNIVPNLPCPPRHRSTSSMFPIQNFGVNGEENMGIVLIDFELNIEKLETFYNNSDAVLLRDLFEKYGAQAKEYYKDDPVGGSKMILTLMKIIMVMDKCAVNEYPLLKEYKSGIDPSIIEELILPVGKDMAEALKLENYFLARNEKARYNCLIEEQSISDASFSVRYATGNPEMQLLKRKIQTECERREKEKIDEAQEKREKCITLRAQASRREHEYGFSDILYKRFHYSWCTKCSLVSQAEGITVTVYERMLPAFENKKNGVVFELMIPSELACLRDMLFEFRRMFPLASSNSETRNAAVGFWVQHLSQYQSESSKAQRYVKLGSSTKLYRQTHYDQSYNPELHFDFIVNNGYNWNYFYNNNSKTLSSASRSSIKQLCTFTVEPGSPYKDLQFAVEGTSHTQNEVLARQIECPQDLSLSEFVEFGSLRAGHHLQWHNIHRALVMGTLSLENESVFSLFCQTIWQAGPKSKQELFIRESDQSIKDPNFAMETLKLLATELTKNEKNWQNPYVIAANIILTKRILSIANSRDIKIEALLHLVSCRIVTTKWCSSIEELLSKMTLAPKEDVKHLRIKLVQIAALSALTLTFLDKPTRSSWYSNDLHSWLESVTKIHDNILLTESSLATLPKMTRNLIRWVRRVGVEAEDSLRYSAGAEAEFDAFVNAHLGTIVTIESREYEGESKQVLRCESKGSVYQMDNITGRFYINGKPIGKLPVEIAGHADFQRIFSGTIFEVRDASGPTDIPGSLSTVLKFNNCVYNFYMANGMLLVTEIHEDGSKFELMSHAQFEGDVPFLLIHKFSHWRDLKNNMIHFRPIDFLSPNFTSPPEYTLNLNTRELIQSKTGLLIVDINTSAYQRIADIMERLERREQILIFSDGTKITAELPRMALHFTADKSGFIKSNEFSGMCIAKTQQLQTFIGLQNGLLLESTDFNVNTMHPMFLVPNGQVQISSSGNPIHHSVQISTVKLDAPEYFAFEVDMRLKRLRAGQSRVGWLYLSYLHAVTASPMPDPFTEMTGTEVALQLLQSPLCWSCEPLDKAAVDILTKISNLSPERAYYPPHLEAMERPIYPSFLTSAAAQDSFRIIVQKIIADSQRLSFLFPDTVTGTDNRISNYNKLCLRAYRRHALLSNEQRQIDKSFVQLPKESAENLLSSAITHLQQVDMVDVRTMAQLCATWTTIPTPDVSILTTLLGNKSELVLQRVVIESDFYTQVEAFKTKFPDSWFDLYEIARVVKNRNLQLEWSLLLAQLAFGDRSIPIQHLSLLHAIAVNPQKFTNKNLPNYNTYKNTSKYNFNEAEVTRIVENCETGFESYYSSNKYMWERISEDEDYKEAKLSAYKSDVKSKAKEIAARLSTNWPNHYCTGVDSFGGVIDISKAKSQLNTVLANWYANLELHNFLMEIQGLIQELNGFPSVVTIKLIPYGFAQFEKNRDSITPASTKELKWTLDYILNENIAEIKFAELARHVFKTGQLRSCDDFEDLFNNLSLSPKRSKPSLNEVAYKAKAERLFDYVKLVVLSSTDLLPYRRALSAAGLFPRLTPTTLIPRICSNELQHNQIRDLLGAVVVLWTLEQKEVRCRKLERVKSMKFALDKELENEGHNFWSPKDHPEWLLLELEMDLMIRKIQVKVASRMLNPLENKSSLLQLNMGEGKTSVILPILIASLANGEQLARVTVLKSLFHTNTEVLRYNLGGLLKRRLYNLPCQRKMEIHAPEALTMLRVYNECMEKRGFVVTLPEHRLSFQLKGYEKCRSGATDAGQLVHVQEWLYQNARDVLDESDEILNVKYQLIYTVGGQQPINGGAARWEVLQKVLKLVPEHLTSIINTGASDAAECLHFEQNIANGPEIFPRCRIFKPECYKELCELVVEDILEAQFPQLNLANRQLVKVFLTESIITKELHSQVMNLFDPQTTSVAHRDTLLILRGILACGVLLLGLTKRWRVNYGENPKAKECPDFPRLMAVPYRAKDVASEKTEFGHPDVAILLTQLNYYYSGLSDLQLMKTFDVLYTQAKPELEYNDWIEKMENVDMSISSLGGINLDDYEQRTNILFPALRRNVFVIDFWLNHFVYPRESKVFEHKMICSPWDLTSAIAVHPVTGFSGTNDTAKLLPPHITQNDLEELKDTNDKVEEYIKGQENNHYEHLPTGLTGLDILRKLVDMKIPVLLDVGALILELSNVQVAEKWLELSPDRIKAAIYFDSMDRLMVKDRQGRESRLELSPYRTSLDQCVIYLDDAHTRGTDLKIPPKTKACVTLGKGLTRDKLVQGCMRMRMLGRGEAGHSLQFLASQEVHNEITVNVSDSEWNEKVLHWASDNSEVAIKDGFLHWVNAGINYTRKDAAHYLFNNCSAKTAEDYIKYGDRCSDAEATQLMTMYGEFRTEQFFVDIAEQRLSCQQRKFLETLSPAERQSHYLFVLNKLNFAKRVIVGKCNEHIPDVRKLAYLLDEEQERELQQELQEERQAPRPQKAQPWKHELNPMLKKFVKSGGPEYLNSKWLMGLPEVFKSTTLWPITPVSWHPHIFATEDFFRVVKILNEADCVDQYLRPPTWIAAVFYRQPAGQLQVIQIFLSPFEVNELMPIFRSEKSKSKLFMFAPRLHPKQDTLLRSRQLWIPSAAGTMERTAGFNQLHSNLLLFSGSQYFADEEEQTAYCQLTGYIPRPRTEAEQGAFDNDWTVNGFVKKQFRKTLNPGLETNCQFDSNPEKLIIGIIERRHEGYSTKCHVSRLVVESTKACFGNND